MVRISVAATVEANDPHARCARRSYAGDAVFDDHAADEPLCDRLMLDAANSRVSRELLSLTAHAART